MVGFMETPGISGKSWGREKACVVIDCAGVEKFDGEGVGFDGEKRFVERKVRKWMSMGLSGVNVEAGGKAWVRLWKK
jgi:hypothetical protein